MSDQVLNILKLTLLGLIYLFFARVLWAVWSEVRTQARQAAARDAAGATAAPAARPTASATTAPVANPAAAGAGVTTGSGRIRRPPKGRGGRAARVVVLEPRQRRGMTLALEGEVTLGRADSCTVTIDDDSFVSQLHLRLYDYDGQPMVEDLNSTNGTFHNGNRLYGSRPLKPGDRIQFGTTVMEAQ